MAATENFARRDTAERSELESVDADMSADDNVTEVTEEDDDDALLWGVSLHQPSIPSYQESGALTNSLESAIQTLVAALQREFARERKEEQKNQQEAFRQQIKRLELEANRQLKKKIAHARGKDRARAEEREQRLLAMVKNLNRLAKEIANQKLQLKKSKQEFEQKLVESDFIQTELQNIGKQMSEQVDSLGDSLLDDSFIEETEVKKFA